MWQSENYVKSHDQNLTDLTTEVTIKSVPKKYEITQNAAGYAVAVSDHMTLGLQTTLCQATPTVCYLQRTGHAIADVAIASKF